MELSSKLCAELFKKALVHMVTQHMTIHFTFLLFQFLVKTNGTSHIHNKDVTALSIIVGQCLYYEGHKHSIL
jgi:hypothetical protein